MAIDIFDGSDIIYTALSDLGVQFDTNNTTPNGGSDINKRYVDRPVVPQVFSNTLNEDIDNTMTDIENAKYASSKITKDNFFDCTACNWKQVNNTMEKDPDYVSDSGSKYWYTESGVYRLSDHWGFGVGSCDWLLNEDPELSWRDDSGKRLGYANFSDFKSTKNKTFPEIFDVLTKQSVQLNDTDQRSEVVYYNYRSNMDEPSDSFTSDTIYNAPIETRFYATSAEDTQQTQSINVVDKVTENVVDGVTENITPSVSGQNGSPINYSSKKPGATSLKNYAFELTTIDKIAKEIVVEADLESKKPYLLKDLEKSNYDKNDYDQIIDICNDMDPTGNRAVFTQWILRRHALDGEEISNAESNDYLQKFLELKNSKKLKNEDADINHYKSFAELKNKVNQVLEETGGYTSKRKEEKTNTEDGIKKLDQEGDIELFVVNTPEAASKEFRNTEWCVKDPKFFESYAETDKNFYYFKKGGQPYLLVHRLDYKDVDDNRPSDDILLDTVKLIRRNNLSSINANIASFYIKNGFVQKNSDPEEYQKMVDSIINDGYGPHLLYDKVITKDNDPENFQVLVERELERDNGRGCLRLLDRHIITREDQDLFVRAVNGVIDGITKSTGRLYDYIKDIPELYEKSINSDIENGFSEYLIDEGYLTKDNNPDLYDKCVREAIKNKHYVGLNWIDKGFITKEDSPELFNAVIIQALKDHNDEYILEKGWVTQDEIDNYRQQVGENTEEQAMDDTEKTSAFEIKVLADFVQDFNRQDELTDDQLNKFLNRLPVTEVGKDLKDKTKEDAKQTGKVITHIPKSLNYPYIEDELAGNQIFYGDMDWMEMSDLSEM